MTHTKLKDLGSAKARPPPRHAVLKGSQLTSVGQVGRVYVLYTRDGAAAASSMLTWAGSLPASWEEES